MKLAIATVCLSGDARPRSSRPSPAAGFKDVEIFENDLLSFNGTPADVRRMVADLGLRDHHLPAVPRLRGHARADSARKPSPAPSASSI